MGNKVVDRITKFTNSGRIRPEEQSPVFAKLQRRHGAFAIKIAWPLPISRRRIYNLNMSGSKKKRWVPQIDITKLDDRDKELFNEFINDPFSPKGVSQDDVVGVNSKA